MKENCSCILFRMTTKRKHNEVTLKTRYEALKGFDKNRPNKEYAIQFNVLQSTLSTCNRPILTIACWIDCFWIFWTTCRGNYRRGWWKWRWRFRWTIYTSLKKWVDETIKTLNRLSLFTEDFSFDTFISKTTSIINQWRNKWGNCQ